jgi:hypothetical protein
MQICSFLKYYYTHGRRLVKGKELIDYYESPAMHKITN